MTEKYERLIGRTEVCVERASMRFLSPFSSTLHLHLAAISTLLVACSSGGSGGNGAAPDGGVGVGNTDAGPNGGSDSGADGSSACAPMTCLSLGKNCGALPDGCGNMLHCGSCSGAQTCGGGGAANVCATPAGGCTAGTASVWQNITPAQLGVSTWCTPAGTAECPQAGQTGTTGQLATYGSNAFVLDPMHAGTVYLGTSSLGIWKSTDCGADGSWTHVNTGTLGSALDAGRNWTMVIDPTDSQILYTVAGYGQGGVFKSTDGGVDWAQVLPDAIMTANGGFMERVTMDPTDHTHLVASFHTNCTGTAPAGAKVVASTGSDPADVTLVTSPTPTGEGTSYAGWGCLAESHDSGGTWALTASAWPWSGGDGPGQTMVDANTWFYGTNGGDGLWITTNAESVGGPTWTEVQLPGASSPTVQFSTGGVYVATDGSYYAGGTFQVIHSTDGVHWTSVSSEYAPAPFSMNGSISIVDTGTTLYACNSGQSTPFSPSWYFTAPLQPATNLTQATTTPMLQGGAYLAYDPVNDIVYSSNMTGGFWRLVNP